MSLPLSEVFYFGGVGVGLVLLGFIFGMRRFLRLFFLWKVLKRALIHMKLHGNGSLFIMKCNTTCLLFC